MINDNAERSDRSPGALVISGILSGIAPGVIGLYAPWKYFGNLVQFAPLIIYVLFIVGLVITCWSVRSTVSMTVVTLVSAFVFGVSGFLRAKYTNTWQRGVDDLGLIPIIFLSVGGQWVVPWSLIMAIRSLRSRYWKKRIEGACNKCGYSLTGLTSSRCPECGAAIDMPAHSSSIRR